MPRITKVYTRTGDDGTTALASGGRVPKDDPRIEAVGAVDELNSAVGAALAAGLDPALAGPLASVQNDLFHLGADLALAPGDGQRAGPHIEPRHAEALERLMDRLSESLEPLENFVLPGGAPGAAALHVARAAARRAERRVLALSRRGKIGASDLVYLNRLSDALFVMARWENARRGVPDTLWDSRK